MIDVSPALQALAGLLCAALAAAVPLLVSKAERALGLSLTAQQTAAVTGAADSGAQLAYGFLVANAAQYGDVPMRNAAIAAGVNHVLASVPNALGALGLTPEHVHAMVEARLGGLLARDPTVTAMRPKAAPPAAAEKPAA